MTWIRTIPHDEATGELKAFYDSDLEKNGYVQNIFQALSLRPDSLLGLAELRATFAADKSLLGRRREELIHTAVSAMNKCRHCTNSHVEKLRKLAGEDIAHQVAQDWRQADLAPDEHIMLEFCEKITLQRQQLGSENIDTLRAAGFSDDQILEIVLHVAYRHFQNIVADALGVEDEPI
jgi:uncharacterized peroxidase-related enzyme